MGCMDPDEREKQLEDIAIKRAVRILETRWRLQNERWILASSAQVREYLKLKLAREEREVFSKTDVLACVDRRADLAHEDVPGAHFLAAVDLRAALLRVGVAAVARRAAAFFMSHGFFSLRPGCR